MGEEEAADEVGLRGPEGDVAVVDIFHVGGGEHAILLECEVEDEGCWCLDGRSVFYCVDFGEGELYRLTSHLAVEYERPMLLDVIVSIWQRMRGRLHIYEV